MFSTVLVKLWRENKKTAQLKRYIHSWFSLSDCVHQTVASVFVGYLRRNTWKYSTTEMTHLPRRGLIASSLSRKAQSMPIRVSLSLRQLIMASTSQVSSSHDRWGYLQAGAVEREGILQRRNTLHASKASITTVYVYIIALHPMFARSTTQYSARSYVGSLYAYIHALYMPPSLQIQHEPLMRQPTINMFHRPKGECIVITSVGTAQFPSVV